MNTSENKRKIGMMSLGLQLGLSKLCQKPFPVFSLPPFPSPSFPSFQSNLVYKPLARAEQGRYQQRRRRAQVMVAQSSILEPKPGENGTQEEKG